MYNTIKVGTHQIQPQDEKYNILTQCNKIDYYRILCIKQKVASIGLRVNCLGRDLLDAFGLSSRDHIVWNIPAGRMDILGEWISSPLAMPRNPSSFMRDALKKHHASQSSRYLIVPEILIMDTWSDLVHTRFRSMDEVFCANYADLCENLKGSVESLGRLDLTDRKYDQHVAKVFELGIQKVYAIDFPAVLDSRKQFRLRTKQIYTSCQRLEQIYGSRFSHISIRYSSIFAEDSTQGDHAYHFSKYTQSLYRKQISLITSHHE